MHLRTRSPSSNASSLSASIESGYLHFYRDALIFLCILIQYSSPWNFLSSHLSDQSKPLTDASANPTVQVIVIFIFVNSIVVSLLFRIPPRSFVAAILPIVPMACWMALSLTWSNYPDLTLRRVSRSFIEVTSIVLLVLSLKNDERKALRLLFWSFFIISIVDLMSMALPSQSFAPGGFVGVHGHNKNSAGLFFSIAVPVFAIGLADRFVSRSAHLALFSLASGLTMLVLTLSKSAIGVFFIVTVIMTLMRIVGGYNVYGRIVVPLIAVLCAVCIVLSVLDLGLLRSFEILFGDSTLTGRDQIWRYAFLSFEKSPILGVGYGALWQVGADVELSLKYGGALWVANEAHNGYLDILAQLGYFGVIFLFVFILWTFARIRKFARAHGSRRAPNVADFCVYILLGAIIYNVTESSFFKTGHGMWFMLLFVSAFSAGHLIERPRTREP